MSPRASLPGAAELFRSTGAGPTAGPSLAAAPPAPIESVPTGPADEPAAAAQSAQSVQDRSATERAIGGPSTRAVRQTRRRIRPAVERMPTGRERHDEKITVYCSPEELVDLESARLTLRAEHGMAVDRGRIVREAIAVVLADFEAKGDASILVRRLRES
jgi:hypothetical protein